jgi:hypothetical protein
MLVDPPVGKNRVLLRRTAIRRCYRPPPGAAERRVRDEGVAVPALAFTPVRVVAASRATGGAGRAGRGLAPRFGLAVGSVSEPAVSAAHPLVVVPARGRAGSRTAVVVMVEVACGVD